MEIEIPEDLSSTKESQIVSGLFAYSKDITPSNLYRYRSCTDYHISAFENDELWLSKPITFNDPHDSLLFIDKEKILNVIESNTPKLSFDKVNRLLKDSAFRKQEEQMFGKEFVNKIIENATYKGKPLAISQEYLKQVNDYNEKRLNQIISLAKRSIKQASLVACFSESVESTLMWAHYSSNHKGFALNYDLQSLYSIDVGLEKIKGSLFIDNKLFPVIYTNKRYDATYYAEFHFVDDFCRQMGVEFPQPFYDKLFYYKSLLFKSLEWAYEREWRMIKLTDNNIENSKPDYVSLPYIRPKEIYLGVDIAKKDKERLIEIAKTKNIKIYQMLIDDMQIEYKMKYIQI